MQLQKGQGTPESMADGTTKKQLAITCSDVPTLLVIYTSGGLSRVISSSK